jgi:hypothetical protein
MRKNTEGILENIGVITSIEYFLKFPNVPFLLTMEHHLTVSYIAGILCHVL